MIAYKLFALRADGIHSLFINKKDPIPFGKELTARCYPTNGFAVREGWHCCFRPVAPHLKMELANGEIRVWAEVEVKDYESYNRPESQGGKWILAKTMKVIRILSDDEVKRIRKGGRFYGIKAS